MIIVLLAFLAFASAAPQYYHHHHGPPPFDHRYQHHHHREDFTAPDYFGDNVFDTTRFWNELSIEMKKFDDMLKDFYQHFPTTAATEGIEGNEFKINLPLSGFNDKEITVKAREGLLMVQAVHKLGEDSQRSYMDLRTLPANVDPSGIWSYADGILKISFRINAENTTVAAVTETADNRSREEMEPHADADLDLDVRDDLNTDDKKTELLTNEIPRRSSVEATTYPVDLKGEYEFVPVSY